MTARLTLDEAAAELRKTPRWLREWLRAHPTDKNGEAYYTPVGRDKLLHPSDLLRIELALREGVKGRVEKRHPRAKRSPIAVEDRISDAQWRLAAELTGDASLADWPRRGK